MSASARLILASGSRHRRALLERLQVAFDVMAPDTDETPAAGEAPHALALRLARAKAVAVAAQIPHEAAFIVGSDQVAELDGVHLCKPGTAQRAIAQLLACSGRTVHFHTAVAVLETRTGRCEAVVEPCTVRFRHLTQALIEHYVAVEAPLDAAGSFYSEGLGITLLAALEGRDPNALVGLPLIALVDLLSRFGDDLLLRAQAQASA